MNLSFVKNNRMFIAYFLRWLFRVAVFLSVLAVDIFRPDLMTMFTEFRLVGPVTLVTVLWALLILKMVIHMLPGPRQTMGMRKSLSETYREPEESFDRLELLEYVQHMNVKAWQVMLVWLIFNSIFGLLYLLGILDAKELILLSIFYYACDTTCMIMFCPFQSFIMKNHCCVSCRIFDWGWFMMFTPLLFIRGFFSWSLFFMSCIVLIRWEVIYARHPERFWRGSNTAIRCENCQDRICRIKKPLRAAIGDKPND